LTNQEEQTGNALAVELEFDEESFKKDFAYLEHDKFMKGG
jgi:hypothetical protein